MIDEKLSDEETHHDSNDGREITETKPPGSLSQKESSNDQQHFLVPQQKRNLEKLDFTTDNDTLGQIIRSVIEGLPEGSNIAFIIVNQTIYQNRKDKNAKIRQSAVATPSDSAASQNRLQGQFFQTKQESKNAKEMKMTADQPKPSSLPESERED